MVPTLADEYRLIALVVVAPAVLIVLAWQMLAWREHRHHGG
jgi:hypothetical protein